MNSRDYNKVSNSGAANQEKKKKMYLINLGADNVDGFGMIST